MNYLLFHNFTFIKAFPFLFQKIMRGCAPKAKIFRKNNNNVHFSCQIVKWTCQYKIIVELFWRKKIFDNKRIRVKDSEFLQWNSKVTPILICFLLRLEKHLWRKFGIDEDLSFITAQSFNLGIGLCKNQHLWRIYYQQ